MTPSSQGNKCLVRDVGPDTAGRRQAPGFLAGSGEKAQRGQQSRQSGGGEGREF